MSIERTSNFRFTDYNKFRLSSEEELQERIFRSYFNKESSVPLLNLPPIKPKKTEKHPVKDLESTQEKNH